MAELTAAPDRVRAQVERALTAQQVNLASPDGRARAEGLIEEALTTYQADALTTNGDGSPEQLERIRRELRDDLLGLGRIAERMLADEDAQEWMVNGPRRIFKDTGDRIERVTDIALPDDRAALRILERLLEHVEGKRLDRITPLIEARLPDGSRLTAAIPPVSSNGHAICTIRRFRLKANSLNELISLEFLSQDAADFLTAAVEEGKNIVVAGRVSSGKTTLLNALGHAIPGS